ncbi:MAG: hemerythrin domain-containing protein [Woeseiaceae bacterium]|nr:hemerythrin domain-containing protein [Woeseiaceae bacterium]
MNKNVAGVLGELRQDHRNMNLLLNLLERESNRLFDGEDTDFELLHDIMNYMTVYPDAVHHPKEDRVYAELKAVRPDLTKGFSRITVDHRNIAELGLKLRDDIASVNADAVISKNAVVSDALRYVNTLRGHMQWEELDLFRRVEEMVAEGHELIEAATFLQTPDPVFGPQVEEKFARLFESVQERIEAD